jgi:Zn-dependent protease
MPPARPSLEHALIVALVAAAAICCLLSPGTAAAQSPTDDQYGAPNLDILSVPMAPAEPAPVESSNPDRSRLASAVHTPGELELTSEHVEESGLLTLLLVALLYLPVMIFNKTTEKNYALVGAWLSRPREWLSWVTGLIPFFRHQLGTLAAGVLATAVLFAFVEPGFPGADGSLEYLIGLVAGFTLVAVTFFCTWRAVVHRLEPESAGHWVVYGPYVLLAGFLVVMARLAHFLPGVVLGTVAEYEPRRELSTRTAGIRVAATYGALMAVGIGAWFAWGPVSAAADEPGAGSATLILDAMLAITAVSALETVVFGLIPLKFMDGEELLRWHTPLWAAMWGASVFWFAFVVLHPALGTYDEAASGRLIWIVLLFSALMIIALGTWAYFGVLERRAQPAEDSAARSAANPG